MKSEFIREPAAGMEPPMPCLTFVKTSTKKDPFAVINIVEKI
jgi:hypothetical protein